MTTREQARKCDYTSTACHHAQEQPGLFEHLHQECATDAIRPDGSCKVAATCKWCLAPCSCPCHSSCT